MIIGDLVKRRFPTGASRRRAERHGIVVEDIGMITQIPWQGDVSDRVWVLWPSKSKHVLEMRNGLGVISEAR